MGSKAQSNVRKAFLEAIRSGDAEAVARLIKRGANIEEPDNGIKPIYIAVQHGHLRVAKVLLENGAEIGSSPEDMLEILQQAGPAKVRSIGCYEGNTHTTFSLEGIDYVADTERLRADTELKLKNINKYIIGDGQTKIPTISHHIYFTNPESPREIDPISLSKTILTIEKLNQVASWKHYFWTNDARFIPEALRNLPGAQIHLIDELQDSIAYHELMMILSGAKEKKGFVAASDIARIMVLENGGIYFDLDYEVYRPEKLLKLMQAFDFIGGKEAEETGTQEARLIGNSIIASTPQHPVITKALLLIKRNYDDERLEEIPDYLKYPCTEASAVAYKAGGPVVSTAYYMAANNKTVDVMMPSEIFYNFLYAQSITPESKCHHPGVIVKLDREAIGADMFCGGWTMTSGKMNMIYYRQNIDAYLFEASALGYTRILKYFLGLGANINAISEIGGTPLYIAAQNSHLETVRFLLENGADVDMASMHGLTPLYIAVQNKHIKVVEVLLEQGADVNKAIPAGSTPLYLAAYYGYADLAGLLLKYGAEINVTVSGISLIQAALKTGNIELLKLLGAEKASVECYAGETTEIFAQEGINYFVSNKRLMDDSAYKLAHLNEFVSIDPRIPLITHQMYFSSTSFPKEMDELSLEITIRTLNRLNQVSNDWKHYFWTNNIDFVPEEILSLQNVEVHLVSELEGSSLYTEITELLEQAGQNAAIYSRISDFVRYSVLKIFGGSYRDLDYEIYRPEKFLELMQRFNFLGGKEFTHDPVFYGSASVSASKDHPIVNTALELLKRNYHQDNIPEYVQYPCHQVFKQVYETGPAIITMATHKSANINGNVDLVMPGYYLFNMDYANAINKDSLCYTGRSLSLDSYPNTIGADLFCGSWHKMKGAEDRIYYQKDLFKAVHSGDRKVVKFLLEQGVSIENGPDIASIEENVMEILLPVGKGRVSFIGCYDSNQETVFAEEGINYQQENQKLIQDALYKKSHLSEFVAEQKIPSITHQIYFATKNSPQMMDKISIEKTIINAQRLNKLEGGWRHIIWTNDLSVIPDALKTIPNLEVRLVDELQDSPLFSSMLQFLEESTLNKKMLVAASDVARLIALKKFGGIYHDLDYEIFRPERLFEFMKAFNFFGGKEGTENGDKLTLVGNSIIAASKNHPVINKAIEIAYNNINGLGQEYAKYPCGKSSELVFKAGGPVITASYLLSNNQNGNVDVVMPNTVFYDFDYIRYLTPDSPCHIPGKIATLREEQIGADMFCGSWHTKKGFYNLNYHAKNNDAYLFEAAIYGYTRLVEFFAQKGADVNAVNVIGAAPLYIAAQNNHTETAKYLISHGANVNNPATTGLTPLYMAVQNKNHKLADMLIKNSAYIEASHPESGATPLYLASHLGDLASAAILLMAGASKEVKVGGKTPMQIAAENGHMEVVKLLAVGLEKYCKQASNQQLAEICGTKVVSPISRVENKVKQEIQNKNELLFQASSEGNLEDVRSLIANGADPNAIHKIGEVEAFPLYMAAQNGYTEIVKLLLKAEAKVNAKLNTDGASALYIASLNRHTEIVRLLLDAGAETEVRVAHYTPLYVAVYNRDYSTVDLLLKAGAKIVYESTAVVPFNVAASFEDEVKDLLFEYYWKFVAETHQNFALNQHSASSSFEVVIARHKEDLSWAVKEFLRETVIVYNKGPDDLNLPDNFKIIKLPNVGKEAHSFLFHIIANYQHLADRILFLQAYPYDHPSYLPLVDFMDRTDSGCENIISKSFQTNLSSESEFLKTRQWESSKYKNLTVKSYDMVGFVTKFVSPDYLSSTSICAGYGSEFAVDKSKILGHSLMYYINMFNTLGDRFPVENHYFERIWDLVFANHTEPENANEQSKLDLFCKQVSSYSVAGDFSELCGQNNVCIENCG